MATLHPTLHSERGVEAEAEAEAEQEEECAWVGTGICAVKKGDKLDGLDHPQCSLNMWGG